MSSYDTLVSLLQAYESETITNAVKSVLQAAIDDGGTIQTDVDSATLRDWAKAIHITWISTITLEQLNQGLKAVGKFTDAEISTEANIYFLEIVIHIDTETIKTQNGINGDSPAIFVSSYITLTSNHVDTTSGQGTNELDTEELVANESIEWTAISNNGTDTIQLITFHASPINPNADFSKIMSTPVQEKGEPNKFYSYIIPTPEANFKKAYSFNFTINNGTQQFTFDPWLGDLSQP